MIKDWLDSIRRSIYNLFSWLGREIAVLLKNMFSWVIDLYNYVQELVISAVFGIVQFFLGLLPSFGTLDTDTLSDIREQVVAWNTLLPISETFSVILFFLSWEVLKIVIAAIHYILGWIKSIIP